MALEEAGEVSRIEADAFGYVGDGGVAAGEESAGAVDAERGQVSVRGGAGVLPEDRGEIGSVKADLCGDVSDGEAGVIARLHYSDGALNEEVARQCGVSICYRSKEVV